MWLTCTRESRQRVGQICLCEGFKVFHKYRDTVSMSKHVEGHYEGIRTGQMGVK